MAATGRKRRKRQTQLSQTIGNFEYNFYYRHDDGKTDWQQAQAGCSANGMNLASITSQEVQDVVLAQLFSGTVLPEPVFIGGNDQNSEGTFEWISGEPWSYNQPLRTTSNDDTYDCIGYAANSDTGELSKSSKTFQTKCFRSLGAIGL